MSALDKPVRPCEPYCYLFDLPSEETDMELCDACGSLWIRQQLTEVDPVSFQPLRIEHGWVRR